MLKKKKTHLVIFFLVCLLTKAYPQEFHTLSVENGLSSNAVFSINQYNEGLIWISTKTGINKFDGFHFKNYTLYQQDKLFLYGHRHAKLLVDRHQRFWVNNNYDIFLYNKKTDNFDLNYSTQKNNTIYDILITDTDHIVLATEKGLMKYNIKTKKTISFPHIPKPHKLLSYNDGLILIVQKDKVFVFDLKTASLRHDFIQPSLLKDIKNKKITAIGIDHQQNVFIGASGKLYTFKLESNTINTDEHLNRQFNNCEIRKILVDKANNVFIGTDGAGIYKVNTNLQLLQSFISDQDNPATIADNSVSDIFIDSDNRIWIGGRGLSYTDPNKLKFQFIQHQTNKPNSLIHNFVRAIAEDHSGNMWLGTKYGISILNRAKNSWRHITQSSSGNVLTTNKILSFTKDKNNNLFVGTYQNGLFKIDPQGKISSFNSNQNGSKKASIYNILNDNDTLWLSKATAGIEKINLKTGSSTKFPIPYVISMTKNAKGDLITGGHTGITFINPQNLITKYDAVKHQIGSIFCVKIDSKSNLWCASEGQGLIKFIEKTKTFKKYTISDGLSSNIVYGILEDKAGNLWLSTTNGISSFNPENEEFTNYSIADGLKIKEFNYGASMITSSGEMVFGGINGFIIFKPEDIINKDFKTNLIFTDLKLFSRSVKIEDENSPLKNVIDQTDKLQLTYNQNAIALDFISVNYTNPTKTVYTWKLEGFDKDWSPIKTDHTATYTNLKPGKYTFRVKATNHQSHFSETERTLSIEISPPFWKTYWAYLFYIITAVIFIYFLFKFYHIWISEVHAKDKINFFINLAHDIRTPLSLIRSPLSIALKNNDFSSNTLHNLTTADNNVYRLSHIINQLLDFEKADRRKTDIKLKPINVKEVLDELCANFIPLTEERNITLIRNYKQEKTNLWVDRDKFDKIIFNLLSNAVKYSKSGGQIIISAEVLTNNYIIRISDKGLGIPKEQQKYIFRRYFRAQNAINSHEVGSGIGLVLTKKLVELHKGTITFESVANIGSTFTISFKTGNHLLADKDFREVNAIASLDQVELKRDIILCDEKDKKPRLLIAEDHKELRDHLTHNLSDSFKIYLAKDGLEALRMSKTIFPDIILSDVMMPNMNGNQLCYEIKNNIETSHIPLVLLTSLTSTSYKIEGIKTGADSYLEKPFEMELLKITLDNLLKNSKRLREKFLKNETSVDDDSLSELDQKFVNNAIQIIEINLSDSEFSVENFEKALGMSHAALYRKFKTLIGKTPLDFINQYRLKKAAELLQTRNYNINEVAYMVGFSDPKYFSTVFKKYFGNNASEYLKK